MDKTMLNNSKLFEKQEIKWFCEGELNKSMKQFRPFYREIVKMFISDLPNIRKFILSKTGKQSIKDNKNNKIRKIGNNTRRIRGG